MKFLEAFYEDNKLIVTCGEKITKPISIERGLGQGCPLSPLLFMLYLQGLEVQLEKSGLGFYLCYYIQGQKVGQSLSRLMYADDIVLMVDNRVELQELMNICCTEGHN